MMQKQEIYALLDSQSIWYEVTEHKAVYNMAEVADPFPFGTLTSYQLDNSRRMVGRTHQYRDRNHQQPSHKSREKAVLGPNIDKDGRAPTLTERRYKHI